MDWLHTAQVQSNGDFLLNEQYANPEEAYLIAALGKFKKLREGTLDSHDEIDANNANLPAHLQ